MLVVVNLGKEMTLTCNPRLEPTYLNVPHNFKVVIHSRLNKLSQLDFIVFTSVLGTLTCYIRQLLVFYSLFAFNSIKIAQIT